MSLLPLRQINDFHRDPKFGRLLLISLIVHGLVWVAFTGDWLGTGTRPKPPVYYVDLIHKPVLNPQAGRPDPRPAKKPQAAAVKRTAAPPPPAPKPAAKPEVKPPPKPKPKPVVQAKPKPAPKPAAKPEQRQPERVQSAIEEIRVKQAREAERDALKEKLAKLRESVGAAAAIPEDVPVGMTEGTGNEAGISHDAYIKEYIQQNWALSPYLLEKSRLATLQTKVKVFYSAEGTLVGFPKVLESSGDKQFDDSVMRAIIKSKQLAQKLAKSDEYVLIFNLKEMAALRR
ncbi:MAG: TonB C-terminal domain-containing protein [Desulfuromonadales bacterium]